MFIKNLCGRMIIMAVLLTAIPATYADTPDVFSLTELEESKITYPKDIFEQSGQTYRVNKSFNNNKLKVAEETYEKGFITHANSDSLVPTQIEFDLTGTDYSFFTVFTGIDEGQGKAGSCRFYIICDGATKKESRVLYGSDEKPYYIKLNISGVKKLILGVTDGGDGYSSDWGVWGEPTLYKSEEQIPVRSEISITSPVTGCVSLESSFTVKGKAEGGDKIELTVNGGKFDVDISSEGEWSQKLDVPEEGMINIGAALIKDGVTVSRDNILAYYYVSKPQTWILKTADTEVTVGAYKDQLALMSLKNLSNGTQWLDAPTVIPLISYVYDGRKTNEITWNFGNAEIEKKNGETTLTLTYYCSGASLALKSVWWCGRQGAVKHNIDIYNNSDNVITVPYQPTMTGMLSAGNAKILNCFTITKGAGTPGDAGIYNDIIEDGFITTVNTTKIPIVFINRDNREGVFIAHEFGTGLLTVQGGYAGKMTAYATSGLNPDFKTDIPPGDKLYIPVSFIGTYEGDQDDASNLLTDWLYEYNVPDIIKEDGWPDVMYNIWFAVGGAVPSGENFYKTVDTAKAAGIDRIILDYGWWKTLGEWDPDPERWPGGMAPYGKYAKDAGLYFVMYFLFHNGNSTVKNALTAAGENAHPEWFANNGNFDDLADLGDEGCVTFIKTKLEEKLNEFHISGFRSDFFPVASSSIQKNRHKYNVDTEYWCYTGFYEILDYLYENVENFSYENCCVGGTYKDFATMKRTANIFSTDTYKVIDARRSFYDTSFCYPAVQIAPEVVFGFVDNPFINETLENKAKMTYGYIYRSVMLGAMYLNLDTGLWNMSKEEHDFIIRQIEIYKQWIRPLVVNADLYHITDRPDGKIWDGMEYFDTESGKGIVYVFRPVNDKDTEIFKLKGLDEKAKYYVRSEDNKTVIVSTGKELMEKGITVKLENQYSSDLLYIQDVKVKIDDKNIAWEGVKLSGGINVLKILTVGIFCLALTATGITSAIILKERKKK